MCAAKGLVHVVSDVLLELSGESILTWTHGADIRLLSRGNMLLQMTHQISLCGEPLLAYLTFVQALRMHLEGQGEA